MDKEEIKTIHVGLTEAKKHGKTLFDYLNQDVEELTDVQQTYIFGYKEGAKKTWDKVQPILEEAMRFFEAIQKRDAEMLAIIRGEK